MIEDKPKPPRKGFKRPNPRNRKQTQQLNEIKDNVQMQLELLVATILQSNPELKGQDNQTILADVCSIPRLEKSLRHVEKKLAAIPQKTKPENDPQMEEIESLKKQIQEAEEEKAKLQTQINLLEDQTKQVPVKAVHSIGKTMVSAGAGNKIKSKLTEEQKHLISLKKMTEQIEAEQMAVKSLNEQIAIVDRRIKLMTQGGSVLSLSVLHHEFPKAKIKKRNIELPKNLKQGAPRSVPNLPLAPITEPKLKKRASKIPKTCRAPRKHFLYQICALDTYYVEA